MGEHLCDVRANDAQSLLNAVDIAYRTKTYNLGGRYRDSLCL
jgi:hypothetical protein